ncbi:hypothetical protein AB4099_33985 [Bosea sp. 2KB_26]|uniref:hypothetical protein n=1 Tax=Bosea sp. 2KB_26 TaxID=3237475 RepID=UPI003F8DE5DB
MANLLMILNPGTGNDRVLRQQPAIRLSLPPPHGCLMTNGPYAIGLTLRRLVHSYGDAAELLKAVRKAHPEATKKDIILAALGVMIDQSETDEVAAKKLHALAMENRGGR